MSEGLRGCSADTIFAPPFIVQAKHLACSGPDLPHSPSATPVLVQSQALCAERGCVALLIAAPASAQGKTSISAGLAQHLRLQGARVRAFKWGPDFLDPSWLQAATDHPVDNIDLAMCGMRDVQARLAQAAAEADVLLIESAMGLFDGHNNPADLAERFSIPILLVMDASHMAETFGALAHGLSRHRKGLKFAGVLANRVGSTRHAELLQRGLQQTQLSPDETPLRWLGGMGRLSQSLPSRHLGLVAATHSDSVREVLNSLASAIANTPMGQSDWRNWSDWRVHFSPVPADSSDKTQAPVERALSHRTIAIARDAAFSFIYPANVACLEALGAQIAWFSPLQGDALPECDALWLPGGYPELHAQALGDLTALAAQIRTHVEEGKPVWAECGGMLALMTQLKWPSQKLDTPLWGVLDGHVTQHDRLQGLGMQAWETPLGLLRGHGFHYSSMNCALPIVAKTQRLLGESAVANGVWQENIYRSGSVLASYFHAWFPSNPPVVARLFNGQHDDLF